MQPGVSFLDIEPAKAALALAPNLRFRCAVCGHVHRADRKAWGACGARLARKWGLYGPAGTLGDMVLPMAFVEIANAQPINVEPINVEPMPPMKWPVPLMLDPIPLEWMFGGWWRRWWTRAAMLIREDLVRREFDGQLDVWAMASRRIFSRYVVPGTCIYVRAGKSLLYRVICPDEVFRCGVGRSAEAFRMMLQPYVFDGSSRCGVQDSRR